MRCSRCNKDLESVNPIYTIKGKELQFCSRACRATETNETVVEVKETVLDKIAKAHPPSEKKERQPRSVSAWNQPNCRLKILRTDQRFSGNRGEIFKLIKNGMTTTELMKLCQDKNLEYNGNMRVIVDHYKCVEVIL